MSVPVNDDAVAEKKPSVELNKDSNGFDVVILKDRRGFSAQVHLYGGQVTSWKNERGEELLFMSSKALFKPPKAIRGGIPICFPQFSNLGLIEQHGFARNSFWSIDPDPSPPLATSDDQAVVDLILKLGDEDKTKLDKTKTDKAKAWNFSFEFRLRVTLGPHGELGLTARVRNVDTKPFTFMVALHTYFSVSDISEVRVEGLETLDYLDNLQNRERFTEQGDALTFESEVDRIYLNAPTKIAIIDHELKRTFVLKKDGFSDAVVWNPWERKAKAMVDLADDEYKHMLCVEPAVIEKPITLKPGEEWKGRHKISTVYSSYHSGQLDPMKVLESLGSFG
ncbi:hypothetical protein KP509_29G016800 [Ceratopteris richardii]|uniref:glucose-6-phosphate 1-epimerase n=1 Tax=Ceratopteris richardii TaxID=49495 RepID=A0A8T2R6N2_CERRI|nr:hypothetical protein KP509_29G016800 [Ceratopteris richardii]